MRPPRSGISHPVPGLFEQAAFRLEDAVLPAADAVAVVDHEDRHGAEYTRNRPPEASALAFGAESG